MVTFRSLHLTPQRQRWLAASGLMVLVVLFRLPPLFNYAAINSDCATVGLQAWHLKEPNLSLLLWGTNYQGVTGPLMTRVAELLIGGPPGFAMRISTVAAYGLLILALFGTLRWSLGVGLAAVASLTLTFCPEAVNYLSYEPCRVWAFTLMFGAIYCAERSFTVSAPWGSKVLALLAGICLGLGVYTDLITLQLLPGLGLYALAWVWASRGTWGRVFSAILGTAVGFIPYFAAGMKFGSGSLRWANLATSWPLFRDQCLPYLMGFISFGWLDDGGKSKAVVLGPLGYGLAVLGTLSFVLLSVWGILLSVRSVSEPLRRLAWMGSGWIGFSLIGFLFSGLPYDVWHARYLVPILLAFPFVAAPALAWLRSTPRLAVALMLPLVASFAAAGWRSYTPGWVEGVIPRVARQGSGEDERVLANQLEQKGVTRAAGHYWVAYRLMYLSREKVLVTPNEFHRYAPFDEEVAKAPRVARLFHDAFNAPAEAQRLEETWNAQKVSFEKFRVGPYLAMVPGP